MGEHDETTGNWHGTRDGYIRYGCRGRQCNDAHTAYQQEARARRYAAAKDPDDPRHGKPSFYRMHGCRCDKCRAGVRTA